MKKRIWKKVIGFSMSAALVVSAGIPSLAAEEIWDFEPEEAVVEEFQEDYEEEILEDFEEKEEISESDEDAFDEFLEPEENPEETSLPQDNVVGASVNDKWKRNQYTVIYHNKTGKKDITEKKTYTYADKDELISASFTREGYYVSGWSYKEADGWFEPGENINILVTLFADEIGAATIDLYAHWTESEYTIVFCDEAGNVLEDQPEGHYGYYDILKYTDKVEFSYAATQISDNLGDGKGVVGFSGTKGGEVDFALGKKYSRLLDEHEGTLLLYPVISKSEYSIHYELGEACLTKALMNYKPGRQIDLPKAVCTGYRFLGWQVDEKSKADDLVMKKVKDTDGREFTVAVAIKKTAGSNIYLTALFEAVRYKVYLSPNANGVKDGETQLKKKVYIGLYNYEGDKLSTEGGFVPSLPERKGYNLIGYSTNPKAKTREECIPENDYSALSVKNTATLYCIWERIPYTLYYRNECVVFNPDSKDKDGKPYYRIESIDDDVDYAVEQTIYYGNSYKPKAAKLQGCTFLGWVLTENSGGGMEGSVVTNKAEIVTRIKADNTADVTLQAYFAENSLKLKFNTNGGKMFNGKGYSKGTLSLMKKWGCPTLGPDYIEEAIGEFESNIEREGYVYKGLYLDKYGRKPLPEDLRELAAKFRTTVIVYAVWDKE